MGDMPPPERRHLKLLPPAEAGPWLGGGMTDVTATQICAALRRIQADVTPTRAHRLLYLAQGHHLGWFSEPLFADRISAWDGGPIIPTLWGQPLPDPDFCGLPNGLLNTVGYVNSRYGKLHRVDLDTLTCAQPPYVEANHGRRAGFSVPISTDTMRAYFLTVDVDDERRPIPAATMAAHLETAQRQRGEPDGVDEVDDLEALRNWRSSRHPETARSA